MKDKEKQINVSTKEEIEERNKKGKEKDELIQALLHYANAEASGGIKSLIDCEGCAFYLYETLGYRKIDNYNVVVEKGFLEYLKDKAKNKDGILLNVNGVSGWFPKKFLVKVIERNNSIEKFFKDLETEKTEIASGGGYSDMVYVEDIEILKKRYGF